MRSTAPLVSVIIPVFNSERYIRQAVESVISQNYEPVEILVVDDGSTDGSASAAEEFSAVRCFRRPHKGISAARNYGIEQASGSFIAFQDADDLWRPGKLRRQMNYLLEHENAAGILGLNENFRDGRDTAWLPAEADELKPEGIQTLVARRSVFDTAGCFNEDYVIGEDIEWLVRVRDAGLALHVLPEVLVSRRVHDANVSRREGQLRKSITARIMKESLDRRRRKTHG